ncbi:hypothetical protein ACJX0J_008284, partial [Zea mays]
MPRGAVAEEPKVILLNKAIRGLGLELACKERDMIWQEYKVYNQQVRSPGVLGLEILEISGYQTLLIVHERLNIVFAWYAVHA